VCGLQARASPAMAPPGPAVDGRDHGDGHGARPQSASACGAVTVTPAGVGVWSPSESGCGHRDAAHGAAGIMMTSGIGE
jgi:hypothetical protein